MSSITNIPINTRSMNGIITISDGVATLEDGDLTGIDTLSANNMNSSILTTTTAPIGTNSTQVATTAFCVNGFVGLGTNNIITGNNTITGTNNFTNLNTFSTSTTDVSPISINYTGIPNQQVQFCPFTSASGFNPYCDANSCYIGGTGDLVVGKKDRFNAIRFTDLSMNLFADTEMILTVQDAPVINLTQTQINTYMQLFSNFVSSTLYENQFLGDIWSAKGLTCKNGLYIQNNITPGSTTYASINSTGNAQFAGISAPTANITTITTTTQANADSSTKCATTAFVKNQNYITSSALTGYAQLSATQTFSGLNTFSQSITGITEATADNSTKVATTAFVKNQNYITSSALTGYALLSGLPQTFSNANTFTQSITGVTEATADNSNKLASTSFVKNQGYSILNASNSFTGQQTLTYASNTFPLRIKSSTAIATREGCHIIANGNGAYNSIVVANDYMVMGRDSATMDIGALCLTTHSNTACGIRITNADVLMTGTTIQTNGTLQANNAITATGTTTTNGSLISNGTHTTNGILAINNAITGPSTSYATTSANIGYVNTITSFTTPTGTGINTLGTYVFDNGANYAYGTYQLVANIRATTTTAGVSIRIALDTVNTVITSKYGDSLATINVGPNILKLTATLKIYTTQTWYLLFQCGTTYTFNSAACTFDIIRIA